MDRLGTTTSYRYRRVMFRVQDFELFKYLWGLAVQCSAGAAFQIRPGLLIQVRYHMPLVPLAARFSASE